MIGASLIGKTPVDLAVTAALYTTASLTLVMMLCALVYRIKLKAAKASDLKNVQKKYDGFKVATFVFGPLTLMAYIASKMVGLKGKLLEAAVSRVAARLV